MGRRGHYGFTVPALDYDVVIPTNGKRFDLLLEAIASVEAQDPPARTIIVVVDGRPDVAARLRPERPQALIVSLESSEGAAAARQRGIDEATAEWVCFLDDDDLWARHKQHVVAEYIAGHPDCEALCAGYWTFAGPGSTAEGINGQAVELRGGTLDELVELAQSARPLNLLDYLDIHGDSMGHLLEYNRGNIGTAMVRRTVLQRSAPVPAGTSPGDDHLLFCAVARQTEWHLIRQRLLFYRLHEGQDTRRSDSATARRILASRKLAWDWVGNESPRPLATYGRLYRRDTRRFLWPLLRARRWGEARRTYKEATALLPRRLDRVLALVPEPIVWRLRHQFMCGTRTHPESGSPTW